MADVQEAVDNSYLTVLLATTKAGKELWMVRKPNCPVRTIAFKGGGQLPECLEGGFSSILIATNAAQDYVDQQGKVKPKAKGRSSS